MTHDGWLRLTASSLLHAILQPRLWPDEVHFGLAARSHIVCDYVEVGALRDVWPIMAGDDVR